MNHKEYHLPDQCQSRDAPVPLPVAKELISRLAAADVRFGLYKNVKSASAGLAALCDLDMLIAADDLERIRSIMISMDAVRGIPSAFYDNANSGREDWFIPDNSGNYIHVDLSVDLTIGRKFRKRYRAMLFAEVGDWHMLTPPAPPLPVASPQDEARIAVLRSVFKLSLLSPHRWVAADDVSTRLLQDSLLHGQEDCTLRYHIGSEEIACRVRRSAAIVKLKSSAIRKLRREIRLQNGHGRLSGFTDLAVHHVRRALYYLNLKLTRSQPGRNASKRRVGPNGFIVTLIGPDGVGKSTQTRRLTSIFQKKFRCASVYLGSNDGGWTKIRAKLRNPFLRLASRRRRKSSKSALAGDPEQSQRSATHVLGSALWRLAVAMRRYTVLQRALRLAASGAIIVSDRWPQNLEPGLLDGPAVAPPPQMRLAHFLSQIEQILYHKMQAFRPSLEIHLDCDFETSHARKPGDIKRDDFDKRIALMNEMRRRNPAIMVIDARQSEKQVATAIYQCAWSGLSRHQADRNPNV